MELVLKALTVPVAASFSNKMKVHFDKIKFHQFSLMLGSGEEPLGVTWFHDRGRQKPVIDDMTLLIVYRGRRNDTSVDTVPFPLCNTIPPLS